MKSERPVDSVTPDSTSEWLNGLAGRSGAGAAHGDGARARAALSADPQDAPRATWRDIEARAGTDTKAVAGPIQPGPPTRVGRVGRGVAANESSPWRKFGWAAVFVLGVGLITLMLPPAPVQDPGLRGVTSQGPDGPRWLVEHPLEAAEALATELRGLHAEVTVTRDGKAALLDIRARPDTWNAVNSRLAALETGLDAEGRLKLSVLPIR